MMTLIQISKILRGQAKQLKITQEELRKNCGISRQTLTHVLSGHDNYKVTTLLAVVDRLGLDIVFLPKAAAVGLQGELGPKPMTVKTGVQAALERIRNRD